MSLLDWALETRQRISDRGVVAGGVDSVREFHYGALRRLDHALGATALNPGTNVLDEHWDALVIVDGCRYDLMTDVVDGYEWIEDSVPFTSLAGGSLSWMRRTFTDNRDLSEIAYITANPFTSRVFSGSRFALLDEVWRYAWDADLGTVRAEAVTDAAIDSFRRTDAERVIVHYMQPHHPFVPDPIAAGINPDDPADHDTTVWEMLRDDTIDHATVWDGYRGNLRYVLNDIRRLTKNLNAPRTVITADHGNAFGERGVYGHGDYPIGALRRVPWCTTTATDDRTADPDVDRDRTEESVSERLRDLGYR